MRRALRVYRKSQRQAAAKPKLVPLLWAMESRALNDVVGGRIAIWHRRRAGSDLDEPDRAGRRPALDQHVGDDRRGVAGPHLGRLFTAGSQHRSVRTWAARSADMS